MKKRSYSGLRTLPIAALAAGCLLHPAFGMAGAAVPVSEKGTGAATVMQNVIILKKEGVYACFPDLAQTADGLLYTKFATRVKNGNNPHADSTGGSATYVSRDGGSTWRPAASYPGDELRGKRKDGSFVLAAVDAWVEIPESEHESYVRKGHFVIRVRSGVSAYLGGVKTVQWKPGQPEFRKPIPGTEDASLMNYIHQIRTRSGVRLTPIYGSLTRPYRPPGTKGGWETSYVARSEDDGTTWKLFPIAAPIRQPDGSMIGFNETTVAEMPDGKLVALMRVAPESVGYLYQSESRDGGKTWSAPVKTPIWGFPAHLLVLKNGDLLASYGYRRAPMGVRACLSRDGGKTWDIENEIVLRADGEGSVSDLGYPQTAQNLDGSLISIYYLTNKDKITHVAATRWTVPSETAQTKK